MNNSTKGSRGVLTACLAIAALAAVVSQPKAAELTPAAPVNPTLVITVPDDLTSVDYDEIVAAVEASTARIIALGA